MDSSSIQLPDSEIGQIRIENSCLRVSFTRAYIVKTMTGSIEKTLWWQAGDLILEGAIPEQPLPTGPAICDGGDIDDNIYTYRDMIPVPLDSRGHTRCELKLRGSTDRIVVRGETVRLELIDTPKYIRHLRE
ncbi:MAG TPA: hypothetical protein DDY14_16110 [Chromatiaceae bacterium]|jgi:hypothetical protein|nr:MAG: hypothetical protein N838_02215 [Thiohalocapsa sp. PB-PSB1]QQO53556.1 MAG: hypothetical protein N838_09535 [Thiohalocapsa sp. PB-PSB1]HBG96807.1 hypothetical protein [Chromatiaceae bacterium]HCS88579.1 hypothetical protein [Chromatiaceae bacterium]